MSFMFETSGFEVIDLCIDVPMDNFVDASVSNTGASSIRLDSGLFRRNDGH